MEKKPEISDLELHTERVTISDDRYLIFYTFSKGSGKSSPKNKERAPNEPQRES